MGDALLKEDQLKSFGEDGYIVLRNIVDPSQIATALKEFERQVDLEPPPDNHTGFHFIWHNHFGRECHLLNCLTQSPALQIAQAMVSPKELSLPDQIQLALNIPPWDHSPGGPHLDGLTPPEEDGRPGSFSLLAGIFLSDQSEDNMGNIWVWPGSHLVNGRYFADKGPESLLTQAPYPPTEHPEPPQQIKGRAGDLLLAHYLLGHNIGGNTSKADRKVLYYRLRTNDHRENWQTCVCDPLFEFAHCRQR